MVCSNGTCGCNADAGLAVCVGNCVDLQTDSTNCGSCGHDCQGSTCSSGFCLPTVAASASSPIWGLAVTPDSLYWTQQGLGGAVAQKPFGSGTQIQTVADGLADPRGIAVDTINAYWVGYADTSVQQIELIGTPGSQTIDWPLSPPDGGGGSYGQPIAVASDGQSVFWVTYQAPGEILSLPIGNPGAQAPHVIHSGDKNPIALAVDGANVYWADYGTPVMPDYNGCIYQIDKNSDNGNPPAIALTHDCNEANPNGIAIDENNVYWVDHLNPGWVKMVPIGGGTVVTLAGNVTSEGGPYAIATLPSTMDTNVYWTDDDDNTVKSISKTAAAGTAPTVLALMQQTPRAIAVDQRNVYWVNYQANSIFEVSK